MRIFKGQTHKSYDQFFISIKYGLHTCFRDHIYPSILDIRSPGEEIIEFLFEAEDGTDLDHAIHIFL